MYPIITISREFGSGGHSIAEVVAKELDIPFYDGEIVNRVAEESGYAKELIEEQGEHSNVGNKWFDMSTAATMYYQSPQDEIFLVQRKVILDCAQKGPCVIVGRCSDYILRNRDLNVLHVLIHADMESRIRRVRERYGGDDDDAVIKKRIIKKDKQRRAYYRYYTDRHWGDYQNYDLALNSGRLGEETCVHMICELAKKPPRQGVASES